MQQLQNLQEIMNNLTVAAVVASQTVNEMLNIVEDENKTSVDERLLEVQATKVSMLLIEVANKLEEALATMEVPCE